MTRGRTEREGDGPVDELAGEAAVAVEDVALDEVLRRALAEGGQACMRARKTTERRMNATYSLKSSGRRCMVSSLTKEIRHHIRTVLHNAPLLLRALAAPPDVLRAQSQSLASCPPLSLSNPPHSPTSIQPPFTPNPPRPEKTVEKAKLT